MCSSLKREGLPSWEARKQGSTPAAGSLRGDLNAKKEKQRDTRKSKCSQKQFNIRDRGCSLLLLLTFFQAPNKRLLLFHPRTQVPVTLAVPEALPCRTDHCCSHGDVTVDFHLLLVAAFLSRRHSLSIRPPFVGLPVVPSAGTMLLLSAPLRHPAILEAVLSETTSSAACPHSTSRLKKKFDFFHYATCLIQ